jgi:hypothetical protein
MAQNLTYEQIIQLPVNPVPPDGVTPNYDDPPRNDTLAITLVVISTVFSITAVAFRLYAKVFCVQRVLWEDCKTPRILPISSPLTMDVFQTSASSVL